MKVFIQEYGIIMVVVAVVLGMLAFGKTGYAKGIQDAILGSADHIVETGENITKSDKKEVNVTAGDILDIEGKGYIVLEKQVNSQALVVTADSIMNRPFQPSSRSDGQNQNTYEGSEIDNYLENDWYNSLSSTMKSAIQPRSIKQASYAKYNDTDSKQEQGYNGQTYNAINRHVFLPSVEEISKIVDLKNQDKVKAFLNGKTIWTRDSYQEYNFAAECIGTFGGLGVGSVASNGGVRAVFAIDLTNLNYESKGVSNFK